MVGLGTPVLHVILNSAPHYVDFKVPWHNPLQCRAQGAGLPDKARNAMLCYKDQYATFTTPSTNPTYPTAGYAVQGSELRTVHVACSKSGELEVTAGEQHGPALCIFLNGTCNRLLQRPCCEASRCPTHSYPAAPAPHGVHAGLKNLEVLKTTQSGFVGYLRDQYTVLPEVQIC